MSTSLFESYCFDVIFILVYGAPMFSGSLLKHFWIVSGVFLNLLKVFLDCFWSIFGSFVEYF